MPPDSADGAPGVGSAAGELFRELDSLGVRLIPDGVRLRCSAAPGVLTDDLVARIREHRVDLLDLLAARELPHTDPQIPSPLSNAQQPIWLAEHLDPGGSAWHLPLAARLLGPLSVMRLRAALTEVARRHDVLRTVFPVRAGRPTAVVTPVQEQGLPLIDLGGLPDQVRGAVLERLIADAARRPFDLSAEPGWRPRLVRIAGQEHHLLITRHHLASDGWSLGVLTAELSALYRCLGEGRPSPLPDLGHRYADFAQQQHQAQPEGLAVWTERLTGAPFRLDLAPTDPDDDVAARSWDISEDDAAAVRAAASAAGCTVFTVLVTAFALALGAAAGRREVVLGVPANGRTHAESRHLIGCFATVLPLRLAPEGLPDFQAALKATHAHLGEALAHQDVPVARIADAVHHRGEPLFDIALAFQNTPDISVDLPGVKVEVADPVPTDPPSPLTVTITNDPGEKGFRLLVDHDPTAVAGVTVTDLMHRFLAVMRIGSTESDLAPGELLSRSDPARQRTVELPVRATLGQRVAAVAARVPDAVAVSQDGSHLTYAGLMSRARAGAAVLRGLGVGPEVPVAVCIPHEPDLVVAVLSVILAGGVCVPVDRADPPARQEAVINGTDVEVVLTDRYGQQNLAWFDGPVLRIDRLPAPEPSIEMVQEPGPDNLAYVIHTSGSTGSPKGVMVTHANVVSLFEACLDEDSPGPEPDAQASAAFVPVGRTWSMTHSTAFDFSVWEMWGPLLSGGRLLIVDRDIARDPPTLATVLAEEQVEIYSSTPSAFLTFTLAAAKTPWPPSPALVVLGGERLDPAQLRGWYDLAEGGGAGRRELVNMYGITETTVHVTAHRIGVRDVDQQASVIGRALTGVSAHVIGPSGVSTAAGARGELWVGGSGVTRGYYERPGWTADRFRPDPFSSRGARVYRSGDEAVARPSGDLVYLGRTDEQVKIRGHRIEPGEIETVLARHPSVSAAAVVAVPSPIGPTLIAHVLSVPDAGLVPAELRAFLQERLPPHLIPSRFSSVDHLPLTANGKLDRSALATRTLETAPVAEEELPRSDTERIIARLWAELLGRDAIGVHDDFFELGGDSLLITRLHARLSDVAGVDLPMRQVYRSPTVAQQATAVDELRAHG